MTIFKILTCTLIAASILIPPALAQPDLPPVQNQVARRKFPQRFLVVSPDGKYVARTEGSFYVGAQGIEYDPEGSVVSLWETASGRLLWQRKSPANFTVRGIFSPDGERFVCHGVHHVAQDRKITRTHSHVNAWAVESGEERLTLKLPDNEQLHELVFTADGQRMIVVLHPAGVPMGSGYVVQEWEAATGKKLRAIEDKPQLAVPGNWIVRHGQLVTSNAITRRGELVQRKIHIWSLKDLQLLHSFEIGEDIAYNKALSPDGKRVAYHFHPRHTEEIAEETYLWNAGDEKPRPLPTPDNLRYNVYLLEFTPDSQTLVGAVAAWNSQSLGTQIWLWDAQTAELKRSFSLPDADDENSRANHAVRLLSDGKSFLVMDGTGKIELRNLEDLSLIRVFE